MFIESGVVMYTNIVNFVYYSQLCTNDLLLKNEIIVGVGEFILLMNLSLSEWMQYMKWKMINVKIVKYTVLLDI